MRKLRHKELKKFVQVHIAEKSQSWDLNPPGRVFRNILLFCLSQRNMRGIGVGRPVVKALAYKVKGLGFDSQH